MATYEQYMQAVRRAHEAGDEEAARRLAKLARQAKGEDVVATTKDGGRVLRQPDGSLSFTSPGYATTDPDTINRIMQGEGAGDVVQSGFDRQTIEQAPITSRAVKAVEGVPFLGSRVDEAAGAMFGDKARQGVRAVSGAMEREKPGQSTALSLGGAVAGSIPMAMAAIPGIAAAAPASRLARSAYGLLAGSAAGATEGAIYGSGEGTNKAERRDNAIQQAQIGGGLGGVLGAAGPLVADLTDAAVRNLKRTDVKQIARMFGLSEPAARVVKQHVDAGDVQAARQALQRAGDDAMLGEATKGSRSLLDATAAMGGRSEAIVNDAIEGRVTRGNAAFRQASDDALGAAPQGVMTAADEISARTAPQRKAAYTKAYATPINYSAPEGRRVEEVLGMVPSDVMRAAIADANEDMIAREMPRNMHIMAKIGDDGSVAFVEKPNVQQLDALKQALQRQAYQNTDDFGRLNGKGQRYNGLAGKLREAVSDATGGVYGDAVAIGGDKIAEDGALLMGSNLLRDNVTRDEVIRTMAGASKDARNSAKVGFRNAINELMDNVKSVASDRNVDAREVQRIVDRLSSKAMREKAALIMGPNDARTFFKEVDRVTSGLNLRAAVSENSRTARRQAVQGSIREAAAPNAVQKAASGEPLEASKQILRLLTGETADAQAFREEGVAEEIAKFLTQTKGRSSEAALKYIQNAMNGQRMTDAQANFVANLLATSGFLSLNRAGQQHLAQ